MAHANTVEIKNPGPFRFPGTVTTALMVLAAIGIVAFGAALAIDSKRAWASFLHNHFYFMSLAIGGAFFAAIQWLTGAMWSAPIRRVAESYTAYLPVALVTFVILYFGIHDLYIWSDPAHVKGDILLEGKAGYLSTPFFMIRNIVAFGIWIFLARKLVGNSVAQDSDGSYAWTARNKVLAPVFLILFAITYTMHSFDTLMSLDPHWFSTMFGVYCFAGLFYSTLALTCLLTVYMLKKGSLVGIVNDNHLHDLGKFMFAFTVFWAYIGFSQFMLIWYANLPEETMYFMHRTHGGWLWVSIFLLVGKFLVPFFALLPRDNKRNPKVLAYVAIWMLFAQWVDMSWLIQPQFFTEGPVFSWIELGTTLGFIGLFGLVIARFLARHNVVAIGDPKLAQSVHHHHQ